ncbi:helix-turn-helix domain-containing protein [Parerythrobacter jejuensis]|uniref:Helix-turn-helix domain-containing protein n=1 Tax=Parerythrobacter jejuensis TaxID=795812 RepID=A0A845AR51_9SPHN|nr:helix-turn-helix domain-containing protein [Parerythrobacter jejuensis]MXP31331.1 helix-turn-helix domain-containing protein [Parerythrobacter jejuensis]MXP34091.1 helix-turn-helix domain-containing protein [Parerythrobacter jejuensis]
MAISGVIETQADDGSGRDARRWSVRLVAEGKLAGGSDAQVLLHNISAGGLLLDCRMELEQGAKLTIDLPEAGPVVAEVVWRSATLHGCRFPDPLPSSVLSAAQLRSAIAPIEDMPVPAMHPQNRATLGKRLAKLRQEKDLTLAQVAEALGVSKPTVWAWEHDRSQPVSKRIGALAEVLGVAEAELLTGRDISQADHVIDEAREVIAEAYGCSPDQVRVMIDL